RFGEQLISVAEIPTGLHAQGTWQRAVLSNPRGRRVVSQLLGAAYIDDWRLMNVNKEAIDQAAEALAVQGELVGDEISGLLDSVGAYRDDPPRARDRGRHLPLPGGGAAGAAACQRAGGLRERREVSGPPAAKERAGSAERLHRGPPHSLHPVGHRPVLPGQRAL